MPRRDVDVRAVAWSGLAIATTIAVAIGAVFLLLHFWRVSPGADRLRLPYAPVAVEGPRLQSAPQPELADARAAKARVLTSSGWVDEGRGIARIPITTAMRILVEQGSTAVVTSAAPAAAPASAPASASGSTR